MMSITAKTGLYIAGAGVAINVVDMVTARTHDSTGAVVIDPAKAFFTGTSGVLKSYPKTGLALIGIGLIVWFIKR